MNKFKLICKLIETLKDSKKIFIRVKRWLNPKCFFKKTLTFRIMKKKFKLLKNQEGKYLNQKQKIITTIENTYLKIGLLMYHNLTEIHTQNKEILHHLKF